MRNGVYTFLFFLEREVNPAQMVTHGQIRRDLRGKRVRIKARYVYREIRGSPGGNVSRVFPAILLRAARGKPPFLLFIELTRRRTTAKVFRGCKCARACARKSARLLPAL